jgi:Recombinase
MPERSRARTNELAKTSQVTRLAYSRRQAADALGVSISTIDRRVVPAIETVKLPWGQRLIPVDELERFIQEHIESGKSRPHRGTAGRPPLLPDAVVARIRLEYAQGRSLGEIARTLTDECVPTAHDGRQWWPSTVRAVLLRAVGQASVANRLSDGASVLETGANH